MECEGFLLVSAGVLRTYRKTHYAGQWAYVDYRSSCPGPSRSAITPTIWKGQLAPTRLELVIEYCDAGALSYIERLENSGMSLSLEFWSTQMTSSPGV